jgi:hypothetical protein
MVASAFGVGLFLSGAATAGEPPTAKKNWPPFAPAQRDYGNTSHVVPATHEPSQTIIPTGGTAMILNNNAEARRVPIVVLSPAAPKNDTRIVAMAPLQQTGVQGGVRQDPEAEMYVIQLEVPSLERVTRRESEKNLQERIRQEGRNRPDIGRVEFPYEPPISTEPYTPRQFPPMTCAVEPNYLCYGRLYFEEKNSERFGWDLGPINPLVSTSIFFWDVLTFPYQFGTDICRCYECSAGYCLPGDPIPYYLYPPQISLTGAILQGGTVVAMVGFFPS